MCVCVCVCVCVYVCAAGSEGEQMERLRLEQIGSGGRSGHGAQEQRHKSRHRDFEHIMDTFPAYEQGLVQSDRCLPASLSTTSTQHS